ncbi:MAG TPA: GAF domain-containing protein [Methylomirabilota bacterium]|nr:GAF domain-containing protein [Methylomirabilota bacterium]
MTSVMDCVEPGVVMAARNRPHRRFAALLRAISGVLDLETVLAEITAAVMAVRSDSVCLVRLVDREAGGYRLARTLGIMADRPTVIPFGTGLSEVVAQTREPLLVLDILQDPRFVDTTWYEARGLTIFYGVPLTEGDEVLGVLSLSVPKGAPPTEEEREDIDLFAAHAALAIKNARLYGEAERRRREAEALAAVARGLTESLDETEVGERIVNGVLAFLGGTFSHLRRRLPDGSLRSVAWSGSVGPGGGQGGVSPAGAGVAGRATSLGHPVWSADALNDPLLEFSEAQRRRLELTGDRALLGVPLRVKGEITGSLMIADQLGRVFTETDIAMLETFADQAALALENARLYGEADERRREAEVLDDVAQSLSSALDLDTALQRIGESARELCRADVVRVALREDGEEAMRFRYWPEARYEGWRDLRIVPGMGAGGIVFETGRPFRTEDYLHDPRVTSIFHEVARAESARAAMVVPISIEGRVEGLLYVDQRSTRVFTDHDEAVLRRLSDHAAIAIANARAFEGEKRARAETETAARALHDREAQLRQAQKMEAIGRLAGGVAHDFNNLLTVISGRSTMLSERLPTDSPYRRDVDLIHKTADRAAGLTRQLLAFSRRQMLQRSVLDLNAVVTDTEVMLRRLIGEDVELVTVLDPGLARVKADRGQIEQILINLAVNARDALPKGGRLTLSTANVELGEAFTRKNPGSHPGSFVQLSVRDNGQGMDAGVQAQIFEPFFTTKEPGKGTGLGLSTVYGIVKQHEGYIAVASELWRGTVFDMYLPPVEAAVAEPEGPLVIERGPTGRETILLVEDEEAVRELARDVLRGAGYRVFEAADAAEAMRLWSLYTDEIQLLLTDMVMPRMTGREIAETLAPVRPDLRVVYMSGYTDDPMVREGETAVPGVFLKKPFSVDGLLQAARTALDGAGG